MTEDALGVPYIAHGTSMERWQEIEKLGLLPLELQANARRSNWPSAPARSEYVYLSTIYALRYGLEAARSVSGNLGEAALVKIDIAALDEEKLYPDEDYIAHILWDSKTFGLEIPKEYRSAKDLKELVMRVDPATYKNLWPDSLDCLGNVLHRGPIGAKSLRCTIFDPNADPILTNLSLDPTLTVINHSFCKKVYDALVRKVMFGEDSDVLPKDLDLYFKMPPLSVPGIEGCFDGEERSKFLHSKHGVVNRKILSGVELESYRARVTYLLERIKSFH